MSSLAGPYRIDRLGPVPKFYIALENTESSLPAGTVVAATNEHHAAGWLTMGIVSHITPFGQGTAYRCKRSELRPALSAKVKTALGRAHPYGADFRPGCTELNRASFNPAMGQAIKNWTSDGAQPGGRSILQSSVAEIQAYVAVAQSKYAAIISNWENTAAQQRAAILASLR